MQYRYSVFVKNMKKIKTHNKKNSTYKLGINKFADLTWEEFQKAYLLKPIQNKNFNPVG